MCRHRVSLFKKCRGCQAEADRLQIAFERDVFLGTFNARGFTEREWINAGHTKASWR